MAEEETAARGASFLTKKIGPLPAGVWIGAAGLIWFFLQRRQKTATVAAQPTAQTDPAGNTGQIDPSTGYVYGTPQDSAGLAANSAVGGTTTGTGGSTIAGQYPDNNAWAEAAINYLVGLGIDPTAANAAVQQFLASQDLTLQQQADVNQAIQRIGSPPSPPRPTAAPTPIVSPPSPGTIFASNPPSGLTVSGKSLNSIALKWNRAVNAQGYTVSWGPTSSADAGSTTVSGTTTTTTINGLQPGTLYYVRVQATPAKPNDGFATVQEFTNGVAGGPVFSGAGSGIGHTGGSR